jgi:membrane associated rhomboid family serine protease
MAFQPNGSRSSILTLIAVNFAVFLFDELPHLNAAISRASLYPCSVENACSTPEPWGVGWITAMFLHAAGSHPGLITAPEGAMVALTNPVWLA